MSVGLHLYDTLLKQMTRGPMVSFSQKIADQFLMLYGGVPDSSCDQTQMVEALWRSLASLKKFSRTTEAIFYMFYKCQSLEFAKQCPRSLASFPGKMLETTKAYFAMPDIKFAAMDHGMDVIIAFANIFAHQLKSDQSNAAELIEYHIVHIRNIAILLPDVAPILESKLINNMLFSLGKILIIASLAFASDDSSPLHRNIFDLRVLMRQMVISVSDKQLRLIQDSMNDLEKLLGPKGAEIDYIKLKQEVSKQHGVIDINEVDRLENVLGAEGDRVIFNEEPKKK